MEFQKLLRLADQVIPYDSIQSPSDPKDIAEYYDQTRNLYRRFHSREGAFHLPIKMNNREKHIDKLHFQAREIEKYILASDCREIVELGCGIGYNLRFLAERLPQVNFIGYDLSEGNLDMARKSFHHPGNIQYRCLDFDRLESVPFKADLIFGIETFCYSNDLNRLMASIKSRLNPGGLFIMFDAFRTDKKMPLEIYKAYRWSCWGWSLNQFHSLQDFKLSSVENKFEWIIENDLTSGILSNLEAYCELNTRMIRFGALMRFLNRIKLLPLGILKHMMSGVFGYHLAKDGYISYRMYVLRKTD